jgi:methionyl-tRNA synthetase
MTDRFIVTADPPTPNGDLHVGHLSGPYFAADVLTRALRLQGKQVAFISNFDDNQPYVVTAGQRLGMTSEQVVSHFQERIASTLAANAIEPDYMGVPDGRQKAFVERFFGDLLDQGKLLVKEEPMPYCSHCERFLFEAYLQGTCPHCGSFCYGNGCEQCSLPNSPKDMGDPLCRVCGRPPAGPRSYRGLFLPLSRYQEELKAYLLTRAGITRQHALDLILGAMERPLPDIPLTYVSDYGFPVSLPGFEGQIWNVRQEILPALINTFDKWRERQPDGGWDWREPEDYEVVCFHGYENAFQYVASFNTQLIASDLGWKLPYANVTNEFYLLEGKKFSTTRNHAVWGADLLSRVPSDAVRFYLALTNPETKETDFVVSEFRDVTDRRLIHVWNDVHRFAGEMLADGRAGQAGSPQLSGDRPRERLQAFAEDMKRAYAIETFSLRRAADRLAAWLEELAARAGSLHAGRPEGKAFEAGLAEVLTGAQAFAVFAHPVMPRFTARLQRSLGWSGTWDCYARTVDPGAVSWPDDLRLSPLADADLDFGS